MAPPVTVKLLLPSYGGLNRLSRNAESVRCRERRAGLTSPVGIPQLQGERQDTIAKVQQIVGQGRREIWCSERQNSVTPQQPPRQSTCKKASPSPRAARP